MNRKKKVYVINRGGHDFSMAKEFGQIVFLSEGKIDMYATATMYRKFVDILRYSEKDDCLLLTGLSTMTAIASAIFSHMHGRVNLLLFRNGKYIERTVVLSELIDKENK